MATIRMYKQLIHSKRIWKPRKSKSRTNNKATKLQKDERKNIKKRNYTSREKREREQYYAKLSRSMKRKEKEFDRDIEQFKKYLELKKMLE